MRILDNHQEYFGHDVHLEVWTDDEAVYSEFAIMTGDFEISIYENRSKDKVSVRYYSLSIDDSNHYECENLAYLSLAEFLEVLRDHCYRFINETIEYLENKKKYHDQIISSLKKIIC